MLLQVLIIATGNYNFFNILTITLCVSLLDDHFLGYGERLGVCVQLEELVGIFKNSYIHTHIYIIIYTCILYIYKLV